MKQMNKLYKQFLQKNLEIHKKNRDFCNKLHVSNGDETPTIYLYDYIDSDPYWGFSPDQMLSLLAQCGDSKTINLRIDSPGGDVFAAKNMMRQLKDHPAEVVVYIDGLAASAATSIAMAGDQRIMNEGSMFMIHNASTVTVGNKDDHQKQFDLLKMIDDQIAKEYASVTGQDESQIVEWLDAETWFNAEKAKEYGFVDEVQSVVSDAQVSNWDLSIYNEQSDYFKNFAEHQPKKSVPQAYKRKAQIISKHI